MYAIRRHANARNGSRLTLAVSSCCNTHQVPLNTTQVVCHRCLKTIPSRSAKRITKKTLEDLTQGPIDGAPLPPADKADLRQDSLQQVVRNTMAKFSSCVVLTKVGNFYELYYEHADEYAPKLGLRLAAKGKDGISMAGFPTVQLGRYLKMLVLDLDKHVAICDEFPEYDDKGKLQTPIPRRVTRVVTPATLIDEEFLDQDKNNFLLSIHQSPHDLRPEHPQDMSTRANPTFTLAWIDISTGEFFIQTTPKDDLSSALLRIGATEIILSPDIDLKIGDEVAAILGLNAGRVATAVRVDGDRDNRRWLARLDQPLTDDDSVKIMPQEMPACQQLFDYIDTHVLEVTVTPMRPQRKEHNDTMLIDRSSIRGLELLKTDRTRGDKGSLLNSIKRTVTQGGTRLLRERLVYPSIKPETINYRLDLLTAFLENQDLHQSTVVHLRQLYDMHRIAQKFALSRGDADDLLCLAKTFSKVKDMVQLIKAHSYAANAKAQALKKLVDQLELEGPEYMCSQIEASIDEQAVISWLTHTQESLQQDDELAGADTEENGNHSHPIPSRRPNTGRAVGVRAQKGDPWVMRRNASPSLETLHVRYENLSHDKEKMQEELRQKLSAPKLVLRFDSKYGHICQSPRTKGFSDSALALLGANPVGNLKTIKTFYLPAWTGLGRQMDSVEFEIRQEEQRIFDGLRQLVVENLVPLRKNAAVMDEIDVATSFATLAAAESWSRPQITTKREHKIVAGRHPTVKLGLQEKGRSFVSNDLTLDHLTRAWLITGPNMAGKSTFLRQNALITILAQIGSYVPAEYAEIGIVDKMFSRIGAADDLFRNESTFMVEMIETAAILRDATDRSFVIMDEVGRGTAPEDGAAVAYASLHHLYNINKCRTLFATHFHGLADKTDKWSHLAQYCTDVYEDGHGSWSFVHKLHRGVNRKSHALKVAGMAGLPQSALDIATQVLAENQVPTPLTVN